MDFSNIFIKIFFLIILFVFIFMIGKIYYFYIFSIKNWKKTEGEIILSDFVYLQKKDADYDTWEQSVKYYYQVNGIDFTNNLITKNLKWSSIIKSVVKNMSVDYKKGQKVTVTYNPKNPKESILDDKFNYFSIVLILVIFLILFYFIF
jgi:hypothetical protein